MADIFILDYKMFPASMRRHESRKDFVAEVLPTLNKMKDLVIDEAQTKNGNGSM